MSIYYTDFVNFLKKSYVNMTVDKTIPTSSIKVLAEMDVSLGQAVVPLNLDNVDYTSSDLVLHGSGKDVIQSGISYKYMDNSGEYVTIEDESEIVPAYTLLQTTTPITKLESLMDMGLWPSLKIGKVEYETDSIFFITTETDKVESDNRRYAPQRFKRLKLPFGLRVPIVSSALNGLLSLNYITYKQYKSYIRNLENILKPVGYTVTTREFTDDEFSYDNNISPETALQNFISTYASEFSDISESDVTVTDCSYRDVMRVLYNAEDEYDRRDIKSRDVYTSTSVNNADIARNQLTPSQPRPNESGYLVLTAAEYNATYASAYSQFARALVPVNFGYRKVKNADNKYVKKYVGIRPVLVTFSNPGALEYLSELPFDTDFEASVPPTERDTTEQTSSFDISLEVNVPSLPDDNTIRKFAFKRFSTPTRNNVSSFFSDDSSDLNGIDPSVRSKFGLLYSILKYEFGSTRVKLITTRKSVDTTLNEIGSKNTLLSWHNYGFAAKINIVDDLGIPIKDKSADFYKLLDIATAFIKGAKAGDYGTPANVIWGAQLNVNPDLTVWEILPNSVNHTDIQAFRNSVLQLTSPITGNKILYRDIQDYLLFVIHRMNAYGTAVQDISPDYTIEYPINRFSGAYEYKGTDQGIVNIPVGSYVQLDNQLDDSLNGIWRVNSGRWTRGDKYVYWKSHNPKSYDELLVYYALQGKYENVRALLAIEYIDGFGDVDETLSDADYISEFYSRIGYSHLNDIKIFRYDDSSSYITLEHDGDTLNFKLVVPIYELNRIPRDSWQMKIKTIPNTNRIVAEDSYFTGIETGDIIMIGASQYTILSVVDYDLVIVGDILPEYIGTATIVPFNGQNINGQKEIYPTSISTYLSGDDGVFKYDVDSAILSDDSKSKILTKIRTLISQNINSVKSLYTNNEFRYLFDSIDGSEYEEFVDLSENEFGIIKGQRVIDIDRLSVMYRKVANELATQIENISDNLPIDAENKITIFEETISVIRGAKILTSKSNPLTVEQQRDLENIKRQLQGKYQDIGKFDVSDF